jgi:hypothetical protein
LDFNAVTKHIARVLAAVLLSIWAYGAHAGDVIRSFNADILVREDGVLDVTETIKVNADGTDIQHGIYRDFPQYVTTPDGTRLTPIWAPRFASVIRFSSFRPTTTSTRSAI